MNHSICCMKCAYAWREVTLPGDERMKIIKGILIKDKECDGCPSKKILKSGSLAFCVTFWRLTGNEKYTQWESDFITKMREVAKMSYRRGLLEDKKD